MVKNINLSNFSTEKNALLNIVRKKITETKITNHNEVFDSKFKVQINSVNELLNAIESKFKKCEILYHIYFENMDHAILSGNALTLPFEMNCTFWDGTAKLEYNFKVDDKNFYKEIVDLNFQSFILQIASLFENLVHLIEILIKKVMVAVKPLISYPLHDFLKYLDHLINLGYRQNDRLNTCLGNHSAFFNNYLQQINNLRNKFIHGYSINLNTDGYNYFVNPLNGSFVRNTPELMVDIFTKDVLSNTKVFISSLLCALKDSTNHHTKKIPA